MAKFRDWVEPAHPAVVQQFDELVDIVRFLKDGFQAEIDQTFDRIARQIGYVVTTTMPVLFQVGEGGKIEGVELADKNLDGTIFEREFEALFKSLSGKSIAKKQIAAGRYRLAVIWVDALKLKLKHDWVEPAHFRRIDPELVEDLPSKVRPEVQEPAHWFDAGSTLAMEEELLISVIDEVYPELRLAERVAVGRRESRRLVPGVREPAHFRRIIEDLIEEYIDPGKLVPGVREPAHFRRGIEDLIEERVDRSKLIPGVREPAHFRRVIEDLIEERIDRSRLVPGVREPAHFRRAVEDLIEERIDRDRLVPGVREPAHFRKVIEDLIEERVDRDRLVPGVREPAHFRNLTDLLEDPEKVKMLGELATLLRKLGL